MADLGLYPRTDLYPDTIVYPFPEQELVRAIRDLPPLRLYVSVLTPSGQRFRWGADDPNVLDAFSGETHSATMPGGFENCSLTLKRKAGMDYADLAEFSTLTLMGAGDMVAWEGRLEQVPRTSGDDLAIVPSAVGWQAHLDDDQSARMIFIDCSFANWQPPSAQLRANDLAGGFTQADTDMPGPVTNPGTYPIYQTVLNDSWTNAHECKAFYNGFGIPLGILYYAWELGPGDINPVDANWSWAAGRCDDDVQTNIATTGTLRAAGPASGFVVGVSTTRYFMLVQYYSVTGGTDGASYPIYWTSLTALGAHFLPVHGTPGVPGGIGIFASDIVDYAVQTWAPKLKRTFALTSTITPSTFAIPQSVFMDPTTASAIVKDATKYDLQDWAVWEGPTFWWHPPGARGRNWRTRVGPSALSEAGPQVDRMWNSVIVQYSDVDGTTLTVGPSGSGANTTSSALTDPDPTNPTTAAGLTRRSLLTMGTTTAAGAIQIGSTFLAEQKLLDSAGDATLTGHVEDDHGVLYPAWAVRPGDRISFLDAHDTSYRRIVSTSWDDSAKTQQISLDSPPQALQALLERLGVVLQPLGIGS